MATHHRIERTRLYITFVYRALIVVMVVGVLNG
jgi:hypothetical protein